MNPVFETQQLLPIFLGHGADIDAGHRGDDLRDIVRGDIGGRPRDRQAIPEVFRRLFGRRVDIPVGDANAVRVRVEQPVVDEVVLQLRFRRLKALEISTTEVAIPNHSQMVLPMFRIL